MRKQHFFLLLIAFIAALSVGLTSCTKNEVPPIKPPINTGGGLQACTDSGTVVQIICAASALNGYYIELDNGLLLQPCQILTNLNVPTVEAGTRVSVAYQLLQGPTACDSMVICLAIDPRAHLAKKVRLTCIERIYSLEDCNETGIVRTHPSCQLRYIEKADSTFFEPVNQQVLASYSDGDKIDFSKEFVCTLVPLCTGYTGVEVRCLRRHVMLD